MSGVVDLPECDLHPEVMWLPFKSQTGPHSLVVVVSGWILREILLSHPFPGGCEVSDFASNVWALWLYSTDAGDKCIVTKYSATLNPDGVITSFSAKEPQSM